jgi:hypothetical protein
MAVLLPPGHVAVNLQIRAAATPPSPTEDENSENSDSDDTICYVTSPRAAEVIYISSDDGDNSPVVTTPRPLPARRHLHFSDESADDNAVAPRPKRRRRNRHARSSGSPSTSTSTDPAPVPRHEDTHRSFFDIDEVLNSRIHIDNPSAVEYFVRWKYFQTTEWCSADTLNSFPEQLAAFLDKLQRRNDALN